MIKDCDRVLEIFGGFMFREFSVSNADIRMEYKLLKLCETEADYFRMKRYGYTWKLNRKMRRTIYALYENAQNHACFEEEMLEGLV